MEKEDKMERLNEIKAAVKAFSDSHLNAEFGGYAQKLCDKLGRKKTLSITSGKKEIWSAAIIYVIARLNFLFDQSQKLCISADTICDFFGVKKSTAGQKATLIEKSCRIRMGEPGLCGEQFTDMFTLVQTPEGIVVPLRMLKEHSTEKKSARVWMREDNRLYTLEVFIIWGPLKKEFVEKNKFIARTIEICGDQTLEDLHNTIFQAFGREEYHMYEFQFGNGPHDPDGERYVLPPAKGEFSSGARIAGDVIHTTIGSIGLKVDQAFGYWFDFGDDWMHQINVVAIGEQAPASSVEYPRVTKREGENPPQYGYWDDAEE